MFFVFFLLALSFFSFVFILPPLVAHQKIASGPCCQWSSGLLATKAGSSFGPRQPGQTRGGEASHTHVTCSFTKHHGTKHPLLSHIIKDRRAPAMNTSSCFGVGGHGLMGGQASRREKAYQQVRRRSGPLTAHSSLFHTIPCLCHTVPYTKCLSFW